VRALVARWRERQWNRKVDYAAQLGRRLGGIWCPLCTERICETNGLSPGGIARGDVQSYVDHQYSCPKGKR
jgi:hypothetical protein